MRRPCLRAVEECYRGDRVRVFRLNRAAIIEEIASRARRLRAERPEVADVRLFGSLARGTAAPGSDADLLLVVSSSPVPFHQRFTEYARYFAGLGIGYDMFVYTQEELARLAATGDPFLRKALADSMPLG